MTATDCEVVAPSARPEAVRALEVRSRLTLAPVRTPAATAETVTLPVAPAAISVGLATVRTSVSALVAATRRLSW